MANTFTNSQHSHQAYFLKSPAVHQSSLTLKYLVKFPCAELYGIYFSPLMFKGKALTSPTQITVLTALLYSDHVNILSSV